MREYVEHPRFGKRPKYSGLEIDLEDPDVSLPYHSPDGETVPGTAVEADPEKQTATVPATHYMDLERLCSDCGKWFLFYALEQKHWYEELGFPLDANCVRCVPCRKSERELQRMRRRYEALVHLGGPSPDEEEELARVTLQLVEEESFDLRNLEKVRAFANRCPDHLRAKEYREKAKDVETFLRAKWLAELNGHPGCEKAIAHWQSVLRKEVSWLRPEASP